MKIGQPKIDSIQEQIVRDALRAILESPQFSKSKRYPAFLEYVVKSTLEGDDGALKERVLAAEVFGRSLDYDSATDSVVRVAAGEVRRRLAQYYNENPEAPVRIDLPIGSYTAEFQFRSTPTDGNPVEHSQKTVNDLATDSEPVIEDDEVAGHRRQTKYLRVIAVSAVLAVLVAGVTFRALRRADPVKNLWLALLPKGQPAMILPGRIPNYTPGPGVGQQLGSNPNFYARSVLSLEDAIVLARVCSLFREYQHDCNISEASTVPLENISGKSLVLIGGFNNVWMMKLLAQLPYQLQYYGGTWASPTGIRAVVEHKPTGNTPMWTTREGASGPQAVIDYVILAKFHSEITDSMVVAIAGLHPAGTISGAEYLFSPEKIGQLFSTAPKGWKGVNFEAVLQIDVMSDSPGRPNVVAARFW
jgi:hypothetical protein